MKLTGKIKWVLSIGVFITILNTSNAQSCSPNPVYTNGGVYPDVSTPLATGCTGSFYQQDFTVVVPPDTLGFPINYVMLDSIQGLPPGVTYACNPPSCIFPGGTSQCFQIFGTPASSGTYNFIIYVHGEASIFGTPMSLNYSYTGYQINIGNYPILTTGSLSATCNSSNGTAWVTASGSSGYTYSWNTTPVSTNDTIYSQSAGIYQVTVNSQYNCASVDTVVISDLGAPVLDTMMITDVSCNGDTSGSAIVFVTGGMAPYGYLWSTGDTTVNITNVGAGIYTVSVHDANGCVLSTGATINQPAQLQVFTSQTDATCFGTNNGSAFANVVGGTGTYDYSWTSGSIAASAPSLSAGSYTVTVTDDNNCTASASLTILQPPVIVTDIISNNTTCFQGADGSATVSISGGSPGYNVLWSTGATTLTANGLLASTYYVSVTDTLGCVANDTVVIGQPTQITIGLTGTDESIFGALDGTVDATVSGGTPGYIYDWDNGDTTQDISGLAGGTYILTVTDMNGCTNSDTITIQTLPGFGVENIQNLFNVYPNPATEYIYVNAGMEGALIMNDLCGKQVFNRYLNPGLQMVRLPELNKGIYLVTITADQQRKTIRLIIR